MMRELLVVLVSGSVICGDVKSIGERLFFWWPCDILLNNDSLLDIHRVFVITGTTSSQMTNTSRLIGVFSIQARM